MNKYYGCLYCAYYGEDNVRCSTCYHVDLYIRLVELKNFVPAVKEEEKKMNIPHKSGRYPWSGRKVPEIKNVIFNPPATIVMWADGTKTVVKAHEADGFDPEVGLSMAITKKALGNTGKYYNEIKKWIEPYYQENECNMGYWNDFLNLFRKNGADIDGDYER